MIVISQLDPMENLGATLVLPHENVIYYTI